MELKELYESDMTNYQLIAEKVSQHGLVIIPDFLTGKKLAQLNSEFDEILAAEEEEGLKILGYDKGAAKIIEFDKLKKSFPTTKEVFFNSDFENIKSLALSEEATFNSEIFVVKDVVGNSHHANDMHFDVMPTFKFFIYLEDTSKENGAFTCVPGSPSRTKAIREKYGSKINFKNRHLSRELNYSHDEVLSVEGKAGTLIIFTTETFHKAGKVSKGERRVMRGHCRFQDDMELNWRAKLKRKLNLS